MFLRLKYMTVNNKIWSFKFAHRIRAWGQSLTCFVCSMKSQIKLSNCSGRTSTELRYPIQGQVFWSDIILIFAGSVYKSSLIWPHIAPSVSGQKSEWLISPGKNEYITSWRHKQPWDQLILRYECTCGGKYARTCPALSLWRHRHTAQTALHHKHVYMKHTFIGGPMRAEIFKLF